LETITANGRKTGRVKKITVLQLDKKDTQTRRETRGWMSSGVVAHRILENLYLKSSLENRGKEKGLRAEVGGGRGVESQAFNRENEKPWTTGRNRR